MKEFYLDHHQWSCPCSDKNERPKKFGAFCDINPERFLFLVGGQYYIVTYHHCNEMGDKYEWRKEIVKAIYGKRVDVNEWEIDRGVNVDKELKDFRIRNKALRKYTYEINYKYSGVGATYAIATKIPYLEGVCAGDKAYEEAKAFLIKMEYDFLLDELHELHRSNMFYMVHDIEVSKTIGKLIKSINKEIKA
jgi:hypothetical protein